MIHGQVAEGKQYLAAAAYAFLPSVKRMLVRSVSWQIAEICAEGHVFAVDYIIEQWSPVVAQAFQDKPCGQFGQINARPLPFQPVCRDKGCGTSTERIQHHVALIRTGPDNSVKQDQRLLGRVAGAFLGGI